ncbi:MAG TPA: NAD-dependent epimerase [Planctomycetaceae bacterium]|nr:NAD-dependent epimerase [Planctomycetaceae bacterium]
MTKIMVTGTAGFIGFHLARRLLEQSIDVVGVDNLNPYYDVKLKKDRLAQLQDSPGFQFIRQDISERAEMAQLFGEQQCDKVVHLAAQAGVRYSLENPYAYTDSNLTGFINILEGCRATRVSHLVYASSSSVYGANARTPFSVQDSVGHPLSLYAATKRANELMAHSYSHLYDLPTTGLRFFTVYGPWGRPDMALYLFTQAILAGEPIQLFNEGRMKRDFTYIDDIVEGLLRVIDQPAQANPDWSGDDPNPASSSAPYRLYNIGNQTPVSLDEFVKTLETCLGKTAIKELTAMQPGDVLETSADTSDLAADFGFQPRTSLSTGIERYVQWYRDYHGRND